MAALAAASLVGMGSALLYQRRSRQLQEAEAKEKIRRQKIKYRQKIRQTAEYQRKKQYKEERKRQLEAQLVEYCYFDGNDEMQITKIDP